VSGLEQGFLPPKTAVVGYARSAMTDEDLRARLGPYLKSSVPGAVDKFLSICTYIRGQYDDTASYAPLQAALLAHEERQPDHPCGRLFYFALPPTVYPDVCRSIRGSCTAHHHPHEDNWLRIIVEKPFGHDLGSSEELSEAMGALFDEATLYRIDHYLGKELAQNMGVLRFSNTFLEPLFNRHHISNVQICFKEDFGTEGRGGYFDKFGILRDVVQNHLMQVLALIAMEPPVRWTPDDIRDEKVKVLRAIETLAPEDLVLGQYTANEALGRPGYKDDEGVPGDSRAPTYAVGVLRIRNQRWHGVPFIFKAGKALDERKAEVRIQFQSVGASLFGTDPDKSRNELVIRFQPNEAIYMKMNMKMPGLEMRQTISELDLTYGDRFTGTRIPDAYERLILDCIRGDQQHFVRRDELTEAWRIFTPVLHAIDEGRVPLEEYKYGTRGPELGAALAKKEGFVRTEGYNWTPESRRRSMAAPR